jgi:hypothetical protein
MATQTAMQPRREKTSLLTFVAWESTSMDVNARYLQPIFDDDTNNIVKKA